LLLSNDKPGKTTKLLEPRSLLVLQKNTRFEWKPGIPARKSDRISDKRVPRG